MAEESGNQAEAQPNPILEETLSGAARSSTSAPPPPPPPPPPAPAKPPPPIHDKLHQTDSLHPDKEHFGTSTTDEEHVEALKSVEAAKTSPIARKLAPPRAATLEMNLVAYVGGQIGFDGKEIKFTVTQAWKLRELEEEAKKAVAAAGLLRNDRWVEQSIIGLRTEGQGNLRERMSRRSVIQRRRSGGSDETVLYFNLEKEKMPIIYFIVHEESKSSCPPCVIA